MADTDATQNLYFTAPLRFSTEAFERFLHEEDFDLKGLQLPIVHTESDLFSPTKRGEELTIYLTLYKLGTSSFTLQTELFSDRLIGRNRIVHVAFDSVRKCSVEIPAELRALLLTIKGEEVVGNLKARE